MAAECETGQRLTEILNPGSGGSGEVVRMNRSNFRRFSLHQCHVPLLSGIFVVALFTGCDKSPAPAGNKKPGFGTKVKSKAPPPPPPVVATETPTNSTSPPLEPQREVARETVPQRRRTKGASYLRAVIATRSYVEDKLTFDMIFHALQLYKAEHGENPQSHEEFMEKIIQANQLVLPPLEEGEKYIYDPKGGELMIESFSSNP